MLIQVLGTDRVGVIIAPWEQGCLDHVTPKRTMWLVHKIIVPRNNYVPAGHRDFLRSVYRTALVR